MDIIRLIEGHASAKEDIASLRAPKNFAQMAEPSHTIRIYVGAAGASSYLLQRERRDPKLKVK